MQESWGAYMAGLPLNWVSVQPENPTVAEPTFWFLTVPSGSRPNSGRIFPFVSLPGRGCT